MNLEEKEINYNTTNSYSTLNSLTETTKTIWFVCHGMGYLSKYFLKYFKNLNAEDNYIIAPQAPSKYYIQPKMYVGANWLTKNNTETGTQNIMNYFDTIFKAENLPINNTKFIVFGYSQGVSVAMRYLARRKIQCNQLIIHSGGIPKELEAKDFEYLSDDTQIILVYGKNDEYLDEQRIEQEHKRALELFGNKVTFHPFDGKHEVNVGFIDELA